MAIIITFNQGDKYILPFLFVLPNLWVVHNYIMVKGDIEVSWRDETTPTPQYWCIFRWVFWYLFHSSKQEGPLVANCVNCYQDNWLFWLRWDLQPICITYNSILLLIFVSVNNSVEQNGFWRMCWQLWTYLGNVTIPNKGITSESGVTKRRAGKEGSHANPHQTLKS